jgi:uncharacterized membrane protein
MPNLHPFLVHFPIALLTTSLVFDILGIVLVREEFNRVGWWAQLTGTLGIGAAVISGLVAETRFAIPAPAADTFNLHQQLAFVTAAAFTALLLWRIGMRFAIQPRSRWMFVGSYLAALGCLWAGAWFGGELVYTFGVGLTR